MIIMTGFRISFVKFYCAQFKTDTQQKNYLISTVLLFFFLYPPPQRHMVQGEGVSCNSSMEAELLTLYSNGIHANLWESGEYFISSIPSYPLYITLNPPQRPHYRFVHNLACEKALRLGKGGLISEEMGRGEVGYWPPPFSPPYATTGNASAVRRLACK